MYFIGFGVPVLSFLELIDLDSFLRQINIPFFCVDFEHLHHLDLTHTDSFGNRT
jgi:hypothetical protein